MRMDRAREGNLGDVKSVGTGVFEMRVDVGPGYRIYYTRRDKTILLLFCGGDKSTQPRDIKRAIALALRRQAHESETTHHRLRRGGLS